MKRVLFRSLIVAFFAVVSLNASAYSWPFWSDQYPNQYHNSGFWMDANSCSEFTVNVFSDNLAYYYQNPNQSGYDYNNIRVGWYGSMYQGLLPGDVVTVVGYYYDFVCSNGTGGIYTDVIPVNSSGEVTIRVNSGSYAGWRTIGPNGPIVFWPTTWILQSAWTGQ